MRWFDDEFSKHGLAKAIFAVIGNKLSFSGTYLSVLLPITAVFK